MLNVLSTLKYRPLAGLIGLIALGCGIFLWWSAWSNSSARIEAAHQRASHAIWIVIHRDELMKGADKALHREDLVSTYLNASTEDQASMQLQQHLKQLIDASGVSIVTAQPLPVRREAGIAVPSVRYQVTGTVAAMKQLLYLIENGRPFMFIDAADISAQIAVGTPAAASSQPSNVALQLDVHAYARMPSNGS